MSAPLLRNALHLAEEMAAQLDARARTASRALACDVSRSAVVRAAVFTWLEDAERRSLDVVIQSIRTEMHPSAAPRRRYPQRWTEALVVRLDRFVRVAAGALARRVTRSAIVRVAITSWLDAPPASSDVESRTIRAALVARGRKAAR